MREMQSMTLKGLTALVTSGPTHEPIDPVRFIGNRSSGKQGHAIAAALAAAGATVTLVSGPTSLPDPDGLTTIRVQTGLGMLAACQNALPVDIAIFAAAVADWRIESPAQAKLKKGDGSPKLTFVENPDILRYVAASTPRPRLVIGFAAETDDMLEQAKAKRAAKNADWILANPIDETGRVFGSDHNTVTLITQDKVEKWSEKTKLAIAQRLVREICTRYER